MASEGGRGPPPPPEPLSPVPQRVLKAKVVVVT